MKKLIILSVLFLFGCQSQFIKDLKKLYVAPKKESRTTLEDIYNPAEPPKDFKESCQSAGMVHGKFYCNNRTMICIKPKAGDMKCYIEKQETKDQRAKEEREYYLSGKAGRKEEFYFYHKKYEEVYKNMRDIDTLIKYGRNLECKKVKSTQKPLLCNKKN